MSKVKQNPNPYATATGCSHGCDNSGGSPGRSHDIAPFPSTLKRWFRDHPGITATIQCSIIGAVYGLVQALLDYWAQ